MDSTQFNPKLQTGRLANPVVTRAELTCGKVCSKTIWSQSRPWTRYTIGRLVETIFALDITHGTKIFFKNKRNNKSEKLHTQITSGTNTVTGRSLTEHIVLSLASGCAGYVTLFCSTELPGRGARTHYWHTCAKQMIFLFCQAPRVSHCGSALLSEYGKVSKLELHRWMF